jgi:hypothetical protein
MYQIQIKGVKRRHMDSIILALVHAGYDAYLSVDEDGVCFTASEEDVTKTKD